MTAGHVRVLAALVAAIALHALLLSWSLPANKHLNISNGPLHVELLKGLQPVETKQQSALQPVVTPAPVPENQHKTIAQQEQRTLVAKRETVAEQQYNPTHRLAIKLTPKPTMQSPAVKTIATAKQQTNQITDTSVRLEHEQLPARHSEPAASSMPYRMPASVQSMLLAHIHYPRRARRHGWQGKGEFQLAIVSQSIRNITMLVSTGHAVLDRAVRRGLASVDHIAIADGQYRLPVEFRLQ